MAFPTPLFVRKSFIAAAHEEGCREELGAKRSIRAAAFDRESSWVYGVRAPERHSGLILSETPNAVVHVQGELLRIPPRPAGKGHDEDTGPKDD
jgi:hypothetical protein